MRKSERRAGWGKPPRVFRNFLRGDYSKGYAQTHLGVRQVGKRIVTSAFDFSRAHKKNCTPVKGRSL